jgi:septum formation protein
MTATDFLPIILASGSPRRKEILSRLGVDFILAPADVDENAIPYSSPREFAIKAAFAKVCAVEPKFERGVIIGVDTIVVLNRKVYGKPNGPSDARRMLQELSGNTHSVISGIAVKETGKSTLLDAVETKVSFRDLTEGDIADYVASGEPLDKAGAYAVQGIGRRLIDHIDGDYYNVVGLPISRLLDMMDLYIDTSVYRCNLDRLENI